MTTNSVAPRLHRSSTERVIAGVCGGLAEYFEVDPSLVRLGFVVGTLWAGLGLVLYAIMAIVVPIDAEAPPMAIPRPERSRSLAALVLIAAGALLLVGNLGWAPWLTWSFFWPVVLILMGGALLVRGSTSSAKTE